MPRYKVTARQDAWIYHECEIEASNKEEAATIAREAWNYGEHPEIKFTEAGSTGFDEIECDEEDCEEIIE